VLRFERITELLVPAWRLKDSDDQPRVHRQCGAICRELWQVWQFGLPHPQLIDHEIATGLLP